MPTVDGVGYAAGSDTSRAAAKSIKGLRGAIQERIYLYLCGRGEVGATDSETERDLGLCHQTSSARRRELVMGGWVRDSHQRRVSADSGRSQTVWVALRERRPGASVAADDWARRARRLIAARLREASPDDLAAVAGRLGVGLPPRPAAPPTDEGGQICLWG